MFFGYNPSGLPTKLAVSCFLHLQDLSISVPCPPSNASICTNKLTQLSPNSPKRHLRNQQNKLCYDNLDPESLYPWRPDSTYLVSRSLLYLKFLLSAQLRLFPVFNCSFPLSPYSWSFAHLRS
ncbi:hypothetical protein CHARACLAT_012018 [Characodon lateralis]|uniref:Uncharacterized protein n=1 Tax=Characodon lateralis TaxID=208331 RepID=A0ABU7EU29_9TELE|nr:hypothetical protein [Characodon lateralis]